MVHYFEFRGLWILSWDMELAIDWFCMNHSVAHLRLRETEVRVSSFLNSISWRQLSIGYCLWVLAGSVVFGASCGQSSHAYFKTLEVTILFSSIIPTVGMSEMMRMSVCVCSVLM